MMPWEKFVEWAFLGLITGLFGIATKSVVALNTNVARMLERLGWHEKTLESHDERIGFLERHRRKS